MSTFNKYELIEHTADIGLKAYGTTLSEAYANAACGMFSIITDLNKVRESTSRSVEVTAGDRESLLVDWLNQLIYLFDTDMLLLKRFDVEVLQDNLLKAICYGEEYDPARHELKLGIKAATYHMLQVDKIHNQVTVILDV